MDLSQLWTWDKNKLSAKTTMPSGGIGDDEEDDPCATYFTNLAAIEPPAVGNTRAIVVE